MDARKRQRLLRVAELAGKHPAYADAIGIKASIQKRKGVGIKQNIKLSVKPHADERKD